MFGIPSTSHEIHLFFYFYFLSNAYMHECMNVCVTVASCDGLYTTARSSASINLKAGLGTSLCPFSMLLFPVVVIFPGSQVVRLSSLYADKDAFLHIKMIGLVYSCRYQKLSVQFLKIPYDVCKSD